MILQNWLDNKWIRKHQTSPQEIGNLLEIVKRDIKDANFRKVSSDGYFVQVIVNERKVTQDTPQDTMQDTMQDAIQDTMQVNALIMVMEGVLTREEIQSKLQLANRDYFRKEYLKPALDSGLIEMTIPRKPTSRNQKYRLTTKGKERQRKLNK